MSAFQRLKALRPWERRLGLGAAAAGTLALAFAVRETHLATLLGVLLIAALAVAVARTSGRIHRWLPALLLAAFALRLGFIVLDQALGIAPKMDASGYHLASAALSEAWVRGQEHHLEATPGVTAYAWFGAVFYYLFGPAELVARAANAALGMGATGFVFGISRRMFGDEAALASGLAYLCLPTLVMLQSEQLRDPLVHFVITGMMVVLVTRGFRSLWALPVYALGLVYLYWLRQETFFVILVPLAFAFAMACLDLRWVRAVLLPRLRWLPPPLRPVRFMPLALIGAAVALRAAEAVLAYAPKAGRFTPQGLSHHRSLLAEGGSAYLTDVAFATWRDVLLFLPTGMAYFLLSPFPWQVHNVRALATFAENALFYYPIVVLALLQLFRRPYGRHHVTLLSFLVVGAALYGLVEANVGTALRHRAQFVWVFFVLAGPLLARWLVPLLRRARPHARAAIERAGAQVLQVARWRPDLHRPLREHP